MTNEPIQVTDAEFEERILKSSLPVIVDFWAPWCGPCKMVAPFLEKMAVENDGKIIIAKVNTDENSEWAARFGIQGIPTLLFISDGKVLHTQVGALPEGMLKNLMEEFLNAVQSKPSRSEKEINNLNDANKINH